MTSLLSARQHTIHENGVPRGHLTRRGVRPISVLGHIQVVEPACTFTLSQFHTLAFGRTLVVDSVSSLASKVVPVLVERFDKVIVPLRFLEQLARPELFSPFLCGLEPCPSLDLVSFLTIDPPLRPCMWPFKWDAGISQVKRTSAERKRQQGAAGRCH